MTMSTMTFLCGRFFDVFLVEDAPGADRRTDQLYLDEIARSDIYVRTARARVRKRGQRRSVAHGTRIRPRDHRRFTPTRLREGGG